MGARVPKHYQTLGVAHNATPAEIKKAYRDKAKQYHPDTQLNNAPAEQQVAEEKFRV
jgi:curved DNA-binding protein CbpA